MIGVADRAQAGPRRLASPNAALTVGRVLAARPARSSVGSGPLRYRARLPGAAEAIEQRHARRHEALAADRDCARARGDSAPARRARISSGLAGGARRHRRLSTPQLDVDDPAQGHPARPSSPRARRARSSRPSGGLPSVPRSRPRLRPANGSQTGTETAGSTAHGPRNRTRAPTSRRHPRQRCRKEARVAIATRRREDDRRTTGRRDRGAKSLRGIETSTTSTPSPPTSARAPACASEADGSTKTRAVDRDPNRLAVGAAARRLEAEIA